MFYTVINIHTLEVACTGKNSTVATRKCKALGGNTAGWFKMDGGVQEATEAAHYLTNTKIGAQLLLILCR